MASDDGLLEVLLWLGGAIAAYFIWQKVSGGVAAVTAPAVNAAADAWVAMTSGPGVVPTGNIILPTGQMVPVANVIPTANADGSTTVNVAGTTYMIQPGTDSNGNWTATN